MISQDCPPASALNTHIAPRPGDGPDDQPQYRQEQNQQHPEHFCTRPGAAFDYVDDGPDIQGQNNQTDQTIKRLNHDDAPE